MRATFSVLMFPGYRNVQGQEFSFELGITPSDAMPGWESAIPTMLEGEVGFLNHES
jgi:hypothetical protein